MLTVRSYSQSSFPSKCGMHPCHDSMQQHPLVICGKPDILTQFLSETHLVGKAFQDYISAPHQFSPFLQEVHIPGTLLRHLFPVLLLLFHSILSMGHPSRNIFRQAGCFPLHVAQVKLLFSRNLYVRSMVTWH